MINCRCSAAQSTPWTAACQASLSITNSCSLLKLMPISLVIPYKHLILSSSSPAFNLSQHLALQMSRFFAAGGQSIGVSALASVLPVKIQSWFPLGLTGSMSLLSKGLSRVFSSTTVWRHQFFGALPSLQSSSHNCTWPLGRPQPWLYGPLSAK